MTRARMERYLSHHRRVERLKSKRRQAFIAKFLSRQLTRLVKEEPDGKVL